MGTDIYPNFEMWPTLSLVVALSTGAALVALAIVSFARVRKRGELAAAAAAMLDPDHPLSGSSLHEGEILLSGVVEHAPGEDVAVKVEVTQRGTETERKGNWSYRWEEADRKITVAPFYLRLTSSIRVKVIPPPEPDVADDLDQRKSISRDSRVLSAELVPGETVHVRGVLQRGDQALPGVETGYRDATYSWELRPANGRMLLSSEPLGKGMQERAAFHRAYGVGAILLVLVLQCSLVPFYARLLGTTTSATVVHREHSTSKGRGNKVQDRYDIVVQLPDGRVGEIRIDNVDFALAQEGISVPVREGAFGWQLGERPTISWFHGPICLFLTSALAFVYNHRRRATRPWFKRKLVHTGSGRLPGD